VVKDEGFMTVFAGIVWPKMKDYDLVCRHSVVKDEGFMTMFAGIVWSKMKDL
jgi:hypothetical protein